MTTTEHLARIRAKCVELASHHAGPHEAAFKSTIAAIDGLLPMSEPPHVEAPDDMHAAWEQDAVQARDTLTTIISAWPEELL